MPVSRAVRRRARIARPSPTRRGRPVGPPRRAIRTFAVAALVAVLGAAALVAPLGAATPPTVDIDTADAETLAATLPGIGPVKARRIVAHRERHGPFGELDGLVAVKGIGPATLERIRAHLLGAPGGIGGERGAPHRGAAEGNDAGREPTRAARRVGAVPRSTSELERATREAVREIVERARREAALAR